MEFLKNHGTKVLGFLQVTVAAVVSIPGLFPVEQTPKLLAVSGLLTAWRGFVNSANAQP